jgi:hypothetical protein
MPRQEFEQRELPRRKADLSSGPPNPQRCRIELEIADLDLRGTVFETTPAQGPDARPELGHAEWLREVIIGPLIQAGDAIVDVVQGGQDQDRAAETRTAENSTDGEAIQSRKNDVKDHEVVGVCPGPGKRQRAIADRVDSVAISHQNALDGVRDGYLILHDQDSQRFPPVLSPDPTERDLGRS